jgi:hypothetical protein
VFFFDGCLSDGTVYLQRGDRTAGAPAMIFLRSQYSLPDLGLAMNLPTKQSRTIGLSFIMIIAIGLFDFLIFLGTLNFK